jgi:hypothetical protein
VALVQVVAGPAGRVLGAERASARNGSHLRLTVRGRASRAVRANIFPPTLKAEVSGPNGNSSIADGLARHHRRSESAVT